jgi:NTE family protein
MQPHEQSSSAPSPAATSARAPTKEPGPCRIAIALQGGGSHGAFTWGVLDRLLEQPQFEIVGISGTSAGAMNAGILADGLHRGGPPAARTALRRYWEDVGQLPGLGSFAPPFAAEISPFAAEISRPWHLDNNPLYIWFDMLTRIWSPYQTNPFNHNPLRSLLERIDFESLVRDPAAPRVFMCATNVRTGVRRVFDNSELSIDVLLASACLPQLYQAVQIGNDMYWDGGYTGNPALAPLYLRTGATDVVIVGINPLVRADVPKTAREIINRIDEISFNSSFMLELGAIAFVEEILKSGAGPIRHKLPFVHGIGDSALAAFGASSKMNNDSAFLHHLHEIGWQAADRWLSKHSEDVGHRSTVDLSHLIPLKDAVLQHFRRDEPA